MARLVDSLLGELDQEAATTRRALERIPGDKLGWKPHARSMSLGQLALHIATIPGMIGKLLSNDGLDLGTVNFDQPAATSKAELLTALDESLRAAREVLGGFNDQKAMATWKLTRGGKELMAAPRVAVARSLMLNHWYHHRGQLTVYLRLLDVPVPSIYGPSADENPFAAA
jgi:uncharacterized damage-inducible protein DinB